VRWAHAQPGDSFGTVYEILPREHTLERLTSQGVLSDATVGLGPDGLSAPLLTYTTWAGVVTPLGVGTLFPDVQANPVVFGSPQDLTALPYLAVLQFPQATASLQVP
jgi:hypothetical protein